VTEFIKDKDGARLLTEKRPYVENYSYSEADGLEIKDGENYKGFPIIPLWANVERQSELVGIKSEIDAYDLIKSGFANDLDDCSQIYWTITNAGGMDDVDLAKFLERLKTVKAATIDDDVKAESHTLEIPYQSRETYLTRLENDMYNDAMALNVHAISAGNVTATAINAAYEALNNKVDRYEYCVAEFIDALLKLLGIDDEPTFVRSKLVNQAEETQMILSAAQYLDDETILKHLPFLSIDEVDDILDKLTEEESNRFKGVDDGSGTEGDESGTEEDGKPSEEDIQSGKA
jgi:SPP1 family phage portal protein